LLDSGAAAPLFYSWKCKTDRIGPHLCKKKTQRWATRRLRYVGKVGTGFTGSTLASLARALRPLIQKEPGLVDPPRERGLTFVKPKLVAQIAFQEWTADGKLRQPVYLGLRDDKNPEECHLPEKFEHS
jgi:ATP-dependent DNA ligase